MVLIQRDELEIGPASMVAMMVRGRAKEASLAMEVQKAKGMEV